MILDSLTTNMSVIFLCSAGFPAEVSRRPNGGHSQAGRAGQEDR